MDVKIKRISATDRKNLYIANVSIGFPVQDPGTGAKYDTTLEIEVSVESTTFSDVPEEVRKILYNFAVELSKTVDVPECLNQYGGGGSLNDPEMRHGVVVASM